MSRRPNPGVRFIFNRYGHPLALVDTHDMLIEVVTTGTNCSQTYPTSYTKKGMAVAAEAGVPKLVKHDEDGRTWYTFPDPKESS